MEKLGLPYVGQASYLLNFKKPIVKIRFDQAAAEEAFEEIVGVSSQQTNIPDNFDPNMARIVFSGTRKSIAISQVSCQLNFNFTTAEMPFDKQLEIIRNNVSNFHSKVSKFKPMDDFGQCAIIIGINFPSVGDDNNHSEYLFEKLLKVNRIGEVANTQVNIGYKIDDLFYNVGISSYETLQFEVKPSDENSNMFHDPSAMKVAEEGVSVRLDINNRPQIIANKNANPVDPSVLFDGLGEFIKNDFESQTGLTI